jgi:hypothetical protein
MVAAESTTLSCSDLAVRMNTVRDFGWLSLMAGVLSTACTIASAQTNQTTEALVVKSVIYNASASWAYFTAGRGWGASGCPNATYVQIHSGLPGRKELLAVVLMAKAQGQRVWFNGTCSSDPNYFDAFYVAVVD